MIDIGVCSIVRTHRKVTLYLYSALCLTKRCPQRNGNGMMQPWNKWWAILAPCHHYIIYKMMKKHSPQWLRLPLNWMHTMHMAHFCSCRPPAQLERKVTAIPCHFHFSHGFLPVSRAIVNVCQKRALHSPEHTKHKGLFTIHLCDFCDFCFSTHTRLALIMPSPSIYLLFHLIILMLFLYKPKNTGRHHPLRYALCSAYIFV